MMIIRTDTGVNFTGSNWANNLYSYLSQYLTGLTHEADSTDIVFSEGFTLRITINAYPTFYIVCNGIDKQFAYPDFYADGTYTITLIKTDDVMIVRVIRTAGVRAQGNGFCFGYIRDADGKYYAGGVGSSTISNLYSIDNYTFFDVTDSSSPNYQMPKMINFKASLGKIAYSDQSPVSDGTYHAFFAKNVVSCSNVNLGDTISLSDGRNFLAVGTNTMIEIESEDEEA